MRDIEASLPKKKVLYLTPLDSTQINIATCRYILTHNMQDHPQIGKDKLPVLDFKKMYAIINSKKIMQTIPNTIYVFSKAFR